MDMDGTRRRTITNGTNGGTNGFTTTINNPTSSFQPSFGQDSRIFLDDMNWPSSVMPNNNLNSTGNYYNNFINEFDHQLTLSPNPTSRVVSSLNRGRSGFQNNPMLNAGTHMQTTRVGVGSLPLLHQREDMDQFPSNLNGYHDYDQGLSYDSYNAYGLNRYLAGYGSDLVRSLPLPRLGSMNPIRNDLSFGRNQTRLGNVMSFQHRALRDNDPLFNHVSLVEPNGNGNGNEVYGMRQVTSFSNFSSLEELKGKLVVVAKDQQGGRFLQRKIEEGNIEDVEMIFSEVKDHISELMVHQFANYIIQKLLDVCNEEQISKLLCSVVQDDKILTDICVDMHGTKVLQKLIENLSTPHQRSLLISVLRHITVVLMKSVNGHHVIQSCFKCFPPEDKKQILNVVADNCFEIATDQSGCCVLQQCVIHAEGELRERLVAEITAGARVLSEHPYGNYVVQHIVGMHMPRVTANIVSQLSGYFISLSTNKHGSNVVEHILKECPDHVETIVREISEDLLRVVQDAYGNYVAQTALAKSRGAVHCRLMTLIQNNYAFLHSHLYGKRVLAKTRTKGSRSFCM